ncbi:hypothetical protein FACS1894186_3980 [Alphaproteobacteria bacterium]|nr:hypothetical protein FACS1894186_3980 [Alphaproteobacteria bacterium]
MLMRFLLAPLLSGALLLALPALAVAEETRPASGTESDDQAAAIVLRDSGDHAFLLGNDDLAEALWLKAAAMLPSGNPLKKQILSRLDDLRERRVLRAGLPRLRSLGFVRSPDRPAGVDIAAGAVYSTNMRLASKETNVLISGLPFAIAGDGAKAGFGYWLNGTWFSEAAGMAWEVGGSAGGWQDGASDTEGEARIRVGKSWDFDWVEISNSAWSLWRGSGSDGQAWAAGGETVAASDYGALRLHAAMVDYHGDFQRKENTAEAELMETLAPGVVGSVGWRLTASDNASAAREGPTAKIEAGGRVAGRVLLHANASFSRDKYSAPDPLLAAPRRDDNWRLSVSLAHRDFVFGPIMPMIGVTYVRRDSTIPMYSYESFTASVAFTFSF